MLRNGYMPLLDSFVFDKYFLFEAINILIIIVSMVLILDTMAF